MLKGGIILGGFHKRFKTQNIRFGLWIPWGLKGKTAMPYLQMHVTILVSVRHGRRTEGLRPAKIDDHGGVLTCVGERWRLPDLVKTASGGRWTELQVVPRW
jgi:hypothetical protein